MPFQYTFRADDLTTLSPEVRDLLENRDRELELYLTQPQLVISRVATQTIAALTAAYISFDTETLDTDGFFAPTSTTITIPSSAPGWYSIFATGSYSQTDTFRFAIVLNDQYLNDAFQNTGIKMFVSAVFYAEANDTIKVQIYNLNNTVSRTITATCRMVRLLA